RGRPAVDGHRLNGQVRPGRRVDGRALEVEAEAGQALRGPVGELDVVARQEPVDGGVVHQVDVGVQAGVAAVTGLRVHVRAGRRGRVRARRAPPAIVGARAGPAGCR